jgi:hypothetical protein
MQEAAMRATFEFYKSKSRPLDSTAIAGQLILSIIAR